MLALLPPPRPGAPPRARPPRHPARHDLLTLRPALSVRRRARGGSLQAAPSTKNNTDTPDRGTSDPASPAQVAALSADLLTAARAEDAAACLAAATSLAALAGPGPPPPAPSTWRTVFSNSPGPSGGRVGPFRGETTQVFHASPPSPTAGTYTNRLAFGGGAVAALELSGTWEAVRPDRVNVVFVDTRWSLLGGLVRGGRAFPPGQQPRGHWSLLYGDDAVRAFTTNKGSLFVLERVV